MGVNLLNGTFLQKKYYPQKKISFFKVAYWVAMETMELHKAKAPLFLGQYFFFAFKCSPFEQIYTHNEMT